MAVVAGTGTDPDFHQDDSGCVVLVIAAIGSGRTNPFWVGFVLLNECVPLGLSGRSASTAPLAAVVRHLAVSIEQVLWRA